MKKLVSSTQEVILSPEQVNLAHVIIKRYGFTQSRLSQEHRDLEYKLDRAKRFSRLGIFVLLPFTRQEMKLMRGYNLDYCNHLAIHIQKADGHDRDIQLVLGLATYAMATEIQLRFSDRH